MDTYNTQPNQKFKRSGPISGLIRPRNDSGLGGFDISVRRGSLGDESISASYYSGHGEQTSLQFNV